MFCIVLTFFLFVLILDLYILSEIPIKKLTVPPPPTKWHPTTCVTVQGGLAMATTCITHTICFGVVSYTHSYTTYHPEVRDFSGTKYFVDLKGKKIIKYEKQPTTCFEYVATTTEESVGFTPPPLPLLTRSTDATAGD